MAQGRRLLLPLLITPVALLGQGGALLSRPARDARVAAVRYEVTFDRAMAVRRQLEVTMRFRPVGSGAVRLSLPAWTPGAYELSWFARHVSDFEATGDGRALDWEKVDHDTWSVTPAGAREVAIRFRYHAETLDNAAAWSTTDFTFFNGTNVFLQPDAMGTDFASELSLRTEDDWLVATGLPGSAADRRWRARDYHELVDMPFFVGAFDLDSMRVADRWVRLATYPRGQLAGEVRDTLRAQIARVFPPMIAIFGDQPYHDYTNLLLFHESVDGGSALEHGNSHVGIYTPSLIGSAVLPSITAHEIFHLWNVKRMRPAELWPYRYDRVQPTPLLWVSEGITDYYADVTQLRGGVIDSLDFLDLVLGKMEETDGAPPVALEDASLSTWIGPTDGTAYLYYPKGSLAGLLLDLRIRDATQNRASLDDVMRDIYRRSWQRGVGFTTAEWWAAVSRASGGVSFAAFDSAYVDGRQPLPYAATFALAGIRIEVDSISEPRLGLYTALDSVGVVVTAMDTGGTAAQAGVQPGDYLISVGGIAVAEAFSDRFRQRYGRADGAVIPVEVRRNGSPLTLQMTVRLAVRTTRRLVWDADASPRALRVRAGLLTGRRG